MSLLPSRIVDEGRARGTLLAFKLFLYLSFSLCCVVFNLGLLLCMHTCTHVYLFLVYE